MSNSDLLLQSHSYTRRAAHTYAGIRCLPAFTPSPSQIHPWSWARWLISNSAIFSPSSYCKFIMQWTITRLLPALLTRPWFSILGVKLPNTLIHFDMLPKCDRDRHSVTVAYTEIVYSRHCGSSFKALKVKTAEWVTALISVMVHVLQVTRICSCYVEW